MPIKSEVIANPKSERVRRVSELADRKGRKRSGRFMVEGPQSVRELLTWHPGLVEDLYVEVESAQPDASFATPVVAQMAGKAMQSGVYVHKVTHAVMHRMSADAQGVLAVADMQAFLDSSAAPDDAAGCSAVVLVDDCVDVFNPKVIRSTVGSLFHLPILTMGTDDFFAWCDTHELAVYAADVYGTDSRQPESLTDVIAAPETLAGAKAVLFGNEARGLTKEVLERTDRIVSIPLYGKAESLNLGTSSAVMLLSLAMSSHVERM